MDKISDSVFTEVRADDVSESPSLLTVIFELTPKNWLGVDFSIQEIVKALLVFLNAHLSLNNSNQVAFVMSLPRALRFLHPTGDRQRSSEDELAADAASGTAGDTEGPAAAALVSTGMYRQFRLVDAAVLREFNAELQWLADQETHHGDDCARSTLAGALSMALAYTNRMQRFDQSVTTTTALALSSTTTLKDSAAHLLAHLAMELRILVVLANDAYQSNYIGIMNAIFAAQKMKVPVDVAKLGTPHLPYLQQAADATKGEFLHVGEPHAMVQTLATAYFVEPCLRLVVILPTNANVDYKASCFLTGKPVDVGYVCLLCLCIMGVVPDSGECPTCKSKFNEKLVARLRQGPSISRKKRKVDGDAEAKAAEPQATPQAAA